MTLMLLATALGEVMFVFLEVEDYTQRNNSRYCLNI